MSRQHKVKTKKPKARKKKERFEPKIRRRRGSNNLVRRNITIDQLIDDRLNSLAGEYGTSKSALIQLCVQYGIEDALDNIQDYDEGDDND